MTSTRSYLWNNYFLRYGDEFENFWKKYLYAEKNILFILGCGFDPRMCDGLQILLNNKSSSGISCLAIDYNEGPSSPSDAHYADKKANMDNLRLIANGKTGLEVKTVLLRDRKQDFVGPRNTTKLFSDIDELKGYSDIVIDISALPLSVYFPLIAKILHILDTAKLKNNPKIPNLHIIVSENILIDQYILQQELDDEAILVYPFMSNLETENPEKIPRIWIPVLGENQTMQMEKISTLINPDEICPILPSPSLDPRRGDNIILEYRKTFDKLGVSSQNIIYGAEQNPFELYREILSTIHRYRSSLQSLGTCKIALSVLSSKLMSISALLAAYESKKNDLDVGIAQVFSKGFTMKKELITDDIKANSELFSLCIFGECYNS